MREAAAAVSVLLLIICACACETVRTTAELAADRSRAVQFFGPLLPNPYAQLGETVSAAGDVNGDGFDDFALAASYENTEGAVYIVFGRNASSWANAQFDFNVSDTPDAASWIKISGTSGAYFGGYGISHGDFNGDGLSDLIFGIGNLGKAYVVFGRRDTSWSSFNITTDVGKAVPGFVVTVGTAKSFVGNAGDMNGDGIEDLLVSNYESVSNPSSAFVVFGAAGDTRPDCEVADLDGTNGFKLFDGTSTLGMGAVMGSAGDLNGDGLNDLVLGSHYSASHIGSAYVLFARNVSADGPWAALVNLTTDLDGNNGFLIKGPFSNAQFGRTAVGTGDVNADGFADVFIGSTSGYAGAWILFGHPAPWDSPFDVLQLNGTDGFHFLSSGENWGRSGGCAGDVNGDGIQDIIIGGSSATNSLDVQTGATVVLFGHAGSWPAEISRDDAVGSVGFLIEGPFSNSQFGFSARGAGDVNSDGLADFVVGAYFHDSYKGSALLVFGVPDDHCAVCSNISAACLICDDGFFLNDTLCSNVSSAASSASVLSDFASSSTSSATSFSSAAVVVVIETGGGGSAGEVATEVAQLLGVDVGQISVVEITPGTFEVTVINEEVAQQLINLIDQCITLA